MLLSAATPTRLHSPCRLDRGQPHATPAAAAVVTAAAAAPRASSSGRRQLTAARAWQQVLDAASGRPYYWNTATNETSWELPAGETAVAGASTGTGAASAAASSTASEATSSSSSSSARRSFDEMVALLAEAYTADSSGMAYWEAARALRGDGVFEDKFFDELDRRSRDAARPAEERELAAKMMARLANPLLRQPAPFEF